VSSVFSLNEFEDGRFDLRFETVEALMRDEAFPSSRSATVASASARPA
jgi:hypothetical protein